MSLIEFKDYPSTDTPINAENLNNNFNELNKANTYSTEERVVGTWIDGKPLYRKVITTESIPANTWKAINLSKFGIYNVDIIYLLSGQAKSTSESTRFVIPETDGRVFFVGNNTQISFYLGNDAEYVLAILEYTKTTD